MIFTLIKKSKTFKIFFAIWHPQHKKLRCGVARTSISKRNFSFNKKIEFTPKMNATKQLEKPLLNVLFMNGYGFYFLMFL